MQLTVPFAAVAPEQPCEPSVKVTVLPASGLPRSSVSFAVSVAALEGDEVRTPVYVSTDVFFTTFTAVTDWLAV